MVPLKVVVSSPSSVPQVLMMFNGDLVKQAISTDAGSLIESQRLQIDGDMLALANLSALFDKFERRFPIVTPREMTPFTF